MNEKPTSILLCIIIFVISLGFNTAQAKPISGLCSDEVLKERLHSKKRYGGQLRIIRVGTPIFKSAKGDELIPDTAAFSEIYKFSAIEENRIQVATYDKKIGWIDSNNLYCGVHAKKAKTSTGELVLKLFVSTGRQYYKNDEERKNSARKVLARETPDANAVKKCAGECRKLSRFSGYYIYKKLPIKGGCKLSSKKKGCYQYLIAKKPRLEANDQFIGWVHSDDAFIWQTSYGLRVSEALPEENSAKLEKTRTKRLEKNQVVCGYASAESALKGGAKDCLIELNGGWEWFHRATRMYAIDTKIIDNNKDNLLYEVFAPVSGGAIAKTQTTNKGKHINDFKRIDVVFLIDGTQSMSSNMERVKETVEKITSRIIKRSNPFKNNEEEGKSPLAVSYRFSFQIYRDWYAKAGMLGDKYLLPRNNNKNCTASIENIKENKDKFLKLFSKALHATENDAGSAGDDHEENLYGGIKEAVKNLRSSCHNNLKLLFVIGDTGYSATNQKNMHHAKKIFNNSEIVRYLMGKKNKENSIITFFIQTDKVEYSKFKITRCKRIAKSDCEEKYKKYSGAFELFSTQSNKIISSIIRKHKKRYNKMNDKLVKNRQSPLPSLRISNNEFISNIGEKSLSGKIEKTIEQYTQLRYLNSLKIDIEGGTAPTEAIKRHISISGYNDVPGMLIAQLLESECSDSIEKCQKGIIEDTQKFYIKKSNLIKKDIWITADNLRNMNGLFDKLYKTLRNNSDDDDSKNRDGFSEILKASLKSRLSIDLDKKHKDMELGELINSGVGIPFKKSSPLFRFSINDYSDPEKVDGCVIQNLITWISSEKWILDTLKGDEIPICGSTNKIKKIKNTDTKYIKIAKYYPPFCGRNIDSEKIKKAKKIIAERCPPLEGLYMPIPKWDSEAFKVGTMSYSYNFANNKDNDSKDFAWIPEEFLP